MLNILAINGSPRGEASNSWKLAKAFIEGMSSHSPENFQLEAIDINRLDIRPCRGCFACWRGTPGKCVIKDDMAGLLEKRLWADVTIWSFPLYYFSVPGALKVLIDRQLPMVLPFIEDRSDGVGNSTHPERYSTEGKRTVLISTCGFYSPEKNYEGVTSIFDHLCGKGEHTDIFCGEGELFHVPQLSELTGAYLENVKKAGREFAEGEISGETSAALRRLILPKDVFEKMANESWN